MESNHLFKEIIYIFIIFKMVSMITAGDVLIDHFKQYFHGLNFKIIQINQFLDILIFNKLSLIWAINQRIF